MSNVIIFRLNEQDDTYTQWYEFLNWKERRGIEEVSCWNDEFYTGNIYKAYRIFDDRELSYILLKWNVTNRGDYHKWMEEKRKIDETVYTIKDIIITEESND